MTTAPAPRATPGPAAGTTARSPTAPSGVTTAPAPRATPGPGASTTAQSPTQAQSPTPQRIALSCRLDSPRAPLNGIVMVTGTGFASSAQVQIGGSYATIVTRRQDSIQVRVPGSSGGGMVRVIQGNESANCGSLSISSR
ncbi:MAG: hypothetical protein M5U28_06130 [Sandaracinaceae bacterium]|nr:hypothetical protein [Sandaracinaceae bacterium]